ncbi:preprotein translocase subunit YajC [Corynebacterium epidermidicanis]|uniref:Preprotein translocase, YajC subunit n=1 Tax=Corynebacterium epidermidicanis TaxID=1050174 RepID=A0A0G3GRU0_9CORY|nr:preprotein translocase subunit YajC [Corynebacterium epidermidicanis]AKK03275.1 preprotein translocase, YajC subunit [Corynebacterium epidermidicanis]
MNQSVLLLVMLIILAIPVVLNSLRSSKQIKEINAIQASLAVGDQVVTASGLHGKVVTLTEEVVGLEVAPGVATTWERRAIIKKTS